VGVTRYLADKSALARLHLPAVREELEPLITRALVGICGVTKLEMLFSARSIQERSRMKEQLEASMDRVDTPEDIWDQAAEILEALTEQAQHRSASIPDLIVAATARVRDLEILHYDRDFDTIARFTEQPVRWIVPPGTVLPHQARARLSAPVPGRDVRIRPEIGLGCRKNGSGHSARPAGFGAGGGSELARLHGRGW
jgi:predicted nucleic acid-binding protein